jgi:hypothetical protein
MLHIELLKETDSNTPPRLPHNLHLGQDDLLMPTLTKKVTRIRPEELGDESLILTDPHPNPVNIPQISEPTELGVQGSSTVESPTKRGGPDPLINVLQIHTAE